MLCHDSHSPDHRDPIGAVPCGGKITLRFFCDENYAVTLRTWDGSQQLYAMEPDGSHRYAATITVPVTPMLFWYDFIIHTPEGDIRYGNQNDGLGGEGQIVSDTLHAFQITVYDPAFATPAYLREGIMYQIFPDRFFRGDGKPTQTQQDKISAAHPDASFHKDWNEAPALDIDPENGDNRALDFFGGTLRGITERLPYLRDLGVTVLYLNPIVRARTNHRYDTGDYLKVDPILGKKKDFTALTEAARAMGIRVIMDGVFSHTGADSLYFNRYGRYPGKGAYQSRHSRYAAWYRFDDFPNRYNAWWGFYTLPAVEKNQPDYQHFLLNQRDGVLPFWMQRGASGWRLDVADELPVRLLQKMRYSVKQADPSGTLIGEVWEDASNKISYGEPRSYCLGDTLDSVMNYPLRRAVIDFFTNKINAGALARLIRHQREVYPTPFYYSLMNLLASHDRVRALNAFAGYDQPGILQMPREEAALVRLTQAQQALAKARMLEALKLVCALPGIPCVYYGDEIGMQGMADPWNRAPMAWDEADKSLRESVKAILLHRRQSPVLQTGFLDVLATDADTLLIRRSAKDGLDVFGQALDAPDAEITITRRLAPFTGEA
ncbi:MAG TPA: glycoside hydrolase family 13 protein [Candidatus Limiplasma sp.]|nr:glycoside hydrolase family 13 protein [Candidatus Limiplasma sp.]HRX08463.1 glycoside hydrolase family 13 protein [Candidatus Limiplasma sp.]